MADFKQNYFQRRTKDRGPRSNNRISSPEVQVIESNGNNLGILNREKLKHKKILKGINKVIKKILIFSVGDKKYKIVNTEIDVKPSIPSIPSK